MGSIPLAALNVRPPEQPANPLDQYAKALQIKGMMQGQQSQQMQLQQQQMALDDQKKVRQAFMDNNGDIDATIKQAAKSGVSPQTLTALQQHSIDIKTKLATLNGDQLKNFAAVHDNAAGLIQPVLDAKTPEAKDAAYQAGLQAIQQNPQMYGINDPSQMPPPQRPNDDVLKNQLALHMGQKEQSAQQMKEREVAAQEMTAQGRKEQGDAALAKNAPLFPPQISMLNKQLQNRYQVLNPGQPLPPEYTVQPGANRQNFEDISSSLEKLEQAAAARAQRNNQTGNRTDARADKSYQFNSGQLEKVATPVDQAISRMSRLQDALAQNSPQADALIGPELLSVMAGGSGSGLRMNEAEISRVVGGRSKWETLKSSINQWQLDPSKATTITDEQRKEIRDLVSEVNSKLTKKQAILDDARQGLIGSDDPMQHRKIVADARTKMTQIDQGAGQGGKIIVTAPDGSQHPFDTQAQADAFKQLAHIP